jgi:hypothetical protein
LRPKSAITRTGRIEPKDGCIKCRSRLRRNSSGRRHHVSSYAADVLNSISSFSTDRHSLVCYSR